MKSRKPCVNTIAAFWKGAQVKTPGEAGKTLFDAWVVHHEWERRIEGGESFYDIRDRFVPFIEELVNRYKGTETNVVCVAHGGFYWMMLPVVLNNVTPELISRYGFEYTACIVAEWRPTGLFCVEWNEYRLANAAQIPQPSSSTAVIAEIPAPAKKRSG